jgi:hypothetical protein
VNINESDILSISSPEALNTQLKGSTATGSTPDAELKNQVQQIQGTILSDKGIMKEIESLLEDDSIKAMLSDPKLLEDVTSYDQQKIEQNTSVQDLMNNPKMQELMKKIEQKIPTE